MHEKFINKYRFPEIENWCLFESTETQKYWDYLCPTNRTIFWDSFDNTQGEKIQSLRVRVTNKEIINLPDFLYRMPNLLVLELPLSLIKHLDNNSIPPQVKILEVDGDGSSTFDKSFTSTTVQSFSTGMAKIKFTPSNFSSLEHLGIKLDSKNTMIKVIGELKTLNSLEIAPYSDNRIFNELENMKLKYLRISGGRTDSIEGIERLTSLTDIWLQDLQKLTDLTPLSKLPELKEITIAYCKNISITPLLSIPKLNKVTLFACGNLTPSEDIPRLKEKLIEARF